MVYRGRRPQRTAIRAHRLTRAEKIDPLTEPLRRTYQAPGLELRGRYFAWGARTYVMAILNITPDSFSGDGIAGDVASAIEHARRFEAEGADIIDIGAESSRPGASEIHPREELRRLLPALEAVRGATELPLSVDTYNAQVARVAIAAGADMVNDIRGLRHDPQMAEVVAEAAVPLIAMHNQRGREHHDVIGDIRAGFEATFAIAAAAGIPRERVLLDPGFGFGWTERQNLEMVRRLPELWELGLPILLGPSRKSTIGRILDLPVDDRVEGTGGVFATAIANGVDIVRVHDVREMVRVVKVADAVVRDNWRPPEEKQS